MLSIGFESISRKTLESVHKHVNRPENFAALVEKVHSYGIMVFGLFMFGFDGDDKSVFMTEKDAVKCGKFAGARHWFVPVSACFDGGEADTLLDIVLRKIEKRDQASQGPTHG